MTTSATVATSPAWSLDHESTTGNNNINAVGNFSTPFSTDFDSDVLSDSTPLKLFLVAMYSAIFLIGSSGNALVVTIVAKNKSLQSPTNIFIANLALSDVLMCLLAVPFTPLNGMVSSWVLGEPLCRMVAMSSALSVHVSTQTSTAIAIDRYFAIVHPFKARLSARQCLVVIALVWSLSLTFSLPLALYQQVEWVRDISAYTCNENWPDIKWVRVFTLASLSLQYLLPCSVISVCYSRVYSALNRRSKNKRHMRQRRNVSVDKPVVREARDVEPLGEAPAGYTSKNVEFIPLTKATAAQNAVNLSSKSRKKSSTTVTARASAVTASKESQELRRKRRTTNMLIAMVAIFVCCWLPLNVIMLIFDYAEDSLKFWPYRLLTFFLAHVIAMSSTVYNPFLYAWLNEAFREEFKKVLPPCLFSCFACERCHQCGKGKSSSGEGVPMGLSKQHQVSALPIKIGKEQAGKISQSPPKYFNGQRTSMTPAAPGASATVVGVAGEVRSSGASIEFPKLVSRIDEEIEENHQATLRASGDPSGVAQRNCV